MIQQGVINEPVRLEEFTDGRTSSEYRRERFGRLLQTHRLIDDSLLDHLLEVYQDSLRKSLTLKAGALHLLSFASILA
jgi:putative hydrolase of the HAD superfamily